MSLYSDFISQDINPTTGVSHYLDKDYYKSEPSYKDMLAKVSPKNRIAQELQKEIMTLISYGVRQSDIKKILEVYRPELQRVSKVAFASLLVRWSTYYAVHLKELKRLIGEDYKIRAEQLIDFYIKNQDNPTIQAAYLNEPIIIESSITDIRALIEKLLLFTELNIPVEYNAKELYKREHEVKQKIMNCRDVELLNGYYAELISILASKTENKKNFANKDNYKAIRILKTCGFVEAAYKWLECFPKK